MSDQSDKEQKPEASVDIFNMQPDAKQEPAQAGIKAEPLKTATAKPSALSGFAAKLEPVHFIGAVVVIAAAWIGWPAIFSRSPSSNSLNGSSKVLVPSEAMADASHAQQDSAPAAASDIAAPTSLPSTKETELQVKVDELQSKLAVAAAQAAKCQVPASSIVATKPKSHRAYSAPRRYVSAVPADSLVKTAKSAEFTLNTIYRGQAWIQNAERTYVVQAGDMISGLQIVRVEPTARQVVTSLGVIR